MDAGYLIYHEEVFDGFPVVAGNEEPLDPDFHRDGAPCGFQLGGWNDVCEMKKPVFSSCFKKA